MPLGQAVLFKLPRELRDQIYHEVLKQSQEIPLTDGRSSVSPRNWKSSAPRFERPQCYLTTVHERAMLVTTTALAQVNQQARAEFSEYLRLANVLLIARVNNFDFKNVMEYLDSPTEVNRNSFLLQHDGCAKRNLRLELGGPYDFQWRANLQKWIDDVDRWAGKLGELGTSHCIVKDAASASNWTRVPPELVKEVYQVWRSHDKGAGKLELRQIFFAVFCRHRVEMMMIGPGRVDALGFGC